MTYIDSVYLWMLLQGAGWEEFQGYDMACEIIDDPMNEFNERLGSI